MDAAGSDGEQVLLGQAVSHMMCHSYDDVKAGLIYYQLAIPSVYMHRYR